MAEQIKYQKFCTTLNNIYTMDHNGASFELKLVEVSALKEQGEFESFKLLFESAGEEELVQNIYSLTHSELGQQDIFLVPVSPKTDLNNKIRRYEAVFSRKREI